jgi:hypothetical protein
MDWNQQNHTIAVLAAVIVVGPLILIAAPSIFWPALIIGGCVWAFLMVAVVGTTRRRTRKGFRSRRYSGYAADSTSSYSTSSYTSGAAAVSGGGGFSSSSCSSSSCGGCGC